MRLLAFALASLPFLPLGGTLVEFPVDGRADPAKLEAAKAKIEFETWDCPRHPLKDKGHVQLPVCASCNQPMTRTQPDPKNERVARVSAEEQRLSVMTGPWNGIGYLRLSTIEKAIKDTGLTLRASGWQLREHVFLEVEATKGKSGDLAKALAPFGKTEIDPKGTLVLVRLANQKGGQDHAAMVAAVKTAGYTVKDTMWIMNQCGGELVTAAR